MIWKYLTHFNIFEKTETRWILKKIGFDFPFLVQYINIIKCVQFHLECKWFFFPSNIIDALTEKHFFFYLFKYWFLTLFEFFFSSFWSHFEWHTLSSTWIERSLLTHFSIKFIKTGIKALQIFLQWWLYNPSVIFFCIMVREKKEMSSPALQSCIVKTNLRAKIKRFDL